MEYILKVENDKLVVYSSLFHDEELKYLMGFQLSFTKVEF